jgi:hypothetical protein
MADAVIEWCERTGEPATPERVTTLRHVCRSSVSTAAILAVIRCEAPHCLAAGIGMPAGVQPIDLDSLGSLDNVH